MMPDTNSYRVDGASQFSVNSYEDLEDAIAELHDELWKAADAVQSVEPLAAKQFLQDAKAKWDALSTYISNMPESTNDDDTVRASSGNPGLRGNGKHGQVGNISSAPRARYPSKA